MKKSHDTARCHGMALLGLGGPPSLSRRDEIIFGGIREAGLELLSSVAISWKD